MQDDPLLDLGERQAGDGDLAVEAQADAAIGADQPLARDRPARQGFQHLDDEHVGRLDDVLGTRLNPRGGRARRDRRGRARPSAGPAPPRADGRRAAVHRFADGRGNLAEGSHRLLGEPRRRRRTGRRRNGLGRPAAGDGSAAVLRARASAPAGRILLARPGPRPRPRLVGLLSPDADRQGTAEDDRQHQGCLAERDHGRALSGEFEEKRPSRNADRTAGRTAVRL